MSVHISIVPSLETVQPPPVQSVPLYWIPHDKFRYDYDDRERLHTLGWKYNPAGTGGARNSASVASQPEVYRVDPSDGFRLPLVYQDLLCGINPDLSRDKALSVLNPALAFCNGETGRFDQPRFMGGWVVTGTERDGKLWVRTLQVGNPPPSASAVLADRTLWGWCVSVRPDGLIGLWHRRGLDGRMYPVRMLVLSQSPCYVPLDEVLRVDGFRDPQWMPR